MNGWNQPQRGQQVGENVYYNNPQNGEFVGGQFDRNSVESATPPDFSRRRLLGLGFSNQEIMTCQNIYNRGGKFTPQFLQSWGYDYNTAKRLRYLFDVAAGKVEIEEKADLKKHLKKTIGHNAKLTVRDLGTSVVTDIPQICLIGGVEDKVFGIYNSNTRPPAERFYRVISVSSTRVVVRTPLKPVIAFRGSMEVEGVIKILQANADGTADVEVAREYARLCNRYAIIAGLKYPEFHLGCMEMMAADGTDVFVFARLVAAAKKFKYAMATERALGSGVFPGRIKPQIRSIAKEVYKRASGVLAEWHDASMDYIIMENSMDAGTEGGEVVENANADEF